MANGDGASSKVWLGPSEMIESLTTVSGVSATTMTS
jgi:hypothetical protein